MAVDTPATPPGALTDHLVVLPTLTTPRFTSDKKAFNLIKHARDEAEHERPSAKATELNDGETLIRAVFVGQYNELKEAASESLQKLLSVFSENENLPSTNKAVNIVTDANAQIVTSKATQRSTIRSLRLEERERWGERERFKSAAGLQRPARYPESLLYHFAIVAVIVIAESVANMYFFAQGSDLGMLGGLLQAILVSVTNVGVAVFVGAFALRAMHHVNPRLRWAGFVGFGLHLMFVFFFNLVAAHYRDLLAADLLNNTRVALDHALPQTFKSPFSISFDSIMLFFAGLVAAGLGLVKGYTADDPYLGYGAVQRRYIIPYRQYESSKAALQGQIRVHVESISLECDRMRNQVKGQIEMLGHLRASGQKLVQRYGNQCGTIQRECARHLKDYRDENCRIRVGPPPEYFSNYPEFPDGVDNAPLKFNELEGLPDKIVAAKTAARLVVTELDAIESRQLQYTAAAVTDLTAFIARVEVDVDQEVKRGAAQSAVEQEATPAPPAATRYEVRGEVELEGQPAGRHGGVLVTTDGAQAHSGPQGDFILSGTTRTDDDLKIIFVHRGYRDEKLTLSLADAGPLSDPKVLSAGRVVLTSGIPGPSSLANEIPNGSESAGSPRIDPGAHVPQPTVGKS